MKDGPADPGRDRAADSAADDVSPTRGGSNGPARTAKPTFTCDLCGHVMLDLHCKLVCERCGYKRDCSDP